MVRVLVVIGFVAVLSLLYYGLYLKNLKKLGERETENVPNLEPVGQTRSFIFLIAAILLVASYIILEYRELDVLEVFVLAVGGYLITMTAVPIAYSRAPQGFYENGILTMSGIVFYNKIKNYRIDANKEGRGLVSFVTRGRFVSLVPSIYINMRETKKLRRFLRKKEVEEFKVRIR